MEKQHHHHFENGKCIICCPQPKGFIAWIDQTLKEIKEARLGYFTFLIKNAREGKLKMTKYERWIHGF